MANYYAYCRSNYVAVKNPARFRALLEEYDVEVIEDEEERIGFLSNTESGLPMHKEDDTDIDDDARIPKLLKEGEVLVIQVIGWESMRYLVGYSIAINWDGRICSCNIDEIYSRAYANFGNKPSTEATY